MKTINTENHRKFRRYPIFDFDDYTHYIYRGGCWNNDREFLTASNHGIAPNHSSRDLGFRIGCNGSRE